MLIAQKHLINEESTPGLGKVWLAQKVSVGPCLDRSQDF